MAAPAYPAWVRRWVSGQWRNKKRPPALRPSRPLALADKVANRREQLSGESRGGGGRPGPAPLCPGKGRALCPGPWVRVLTPRLFCVVCESRTLCRNTAFTLKIQSGAGWLQCFAFCWQQLLGPEALI